MNLQINDADVERFVAGTVAALLTGRSSDAERLAIDIRSTVVTALKEEIASLDLRAIVRSAIDQRVREVAEAAVDQHVRAMIRAEAKRQITSVQLALRETTS